VSASESPAWISRVEEYDGRESVMIAATQLESPTVTRSQARRIYHEWLEFFRAPSPIRHLDLRSRVPQEVLDAVGAQTQLVSLAVKWGPYSDLSAIAGLTALRELNLSGATRVNDLSPLTALPSLRTLALDGVTSVSDPSPLSRLTKLETLAYGNASLGSDALVKIADLEWLRPLVELRTVYLIGVKVARPDLAPLLALPRLESIGLSMRREFRHQARELAGQSRAFADLHDGFESRARFIAERGATRQRIG
jgi:Leucine-rich repeat (LRR) protein